MMNSGVSDHHRERGLGGLNADGSNGDILMKINSILHNKLDLGDFFGPDGNNNSSPSLPSPSLRGYPQSQASSPLFRSPSDKFAEQQQQLLPSSPSRLLSPSSPLGGVLCQTANGGEHHHHEKGSSSPSPSLASAQSRSHSVGNQRIHEILGLSSPPHMDAYAKNSRKCGEFRFPDVGSTPSTPSSLGKILGSSRDYEDLVMSPSGLGSGSRFRFGGGESSIGVPSSSTSTLSGSSNHHFSFANSVGGASSRLSSTNGPASPSFDEAILMGVSDKWDMCGGAERTPPPVYEYGSSNHHQHSGAMGGEHGISDIFKNLALNESPQVGSYCGSTSSTGAGSSALDSPPPAGGSHHSYFSASSSRGGNGMLSSEASVKNIYAYDGVDPPAPPSSSLERAARIHRNGTAIYDASCTWHGTFPQRKDKNIQLSVKVFLGGVPWDITEGALLTTFKPFGPIKIEWPGKDNSSVPRGYLYIIFENEKQVKDLLNACTHDYGNGGSWYFKISSRRMRNKEVQVIPWVISDSNFVRCPSQRLDPKKTVFVGALHGMLTAEGLCSIFHDLFGGVVYAGVDTDKYKYPQGSGRVTFNNHRSYMKAVSAAFIEIKAPKFTKKVQVDPYLEDELCSSCGLRQGPYFCRDQACFKYFCRCCWELYHGPELNHHNPLMRNSKPNSPIRSPTGTASTSGVLSFSD